MTQEQFDKAKGIKEQLNLIDAYASGCVVGVAFNIPGDVRTFTIKVDQKTRDAIRIIFDEYVSSLKKEFEEL